ncbi:uncharacterized protein LOC144871140 [Branchiostoma floridae x Branchiostoma japonicum]
MAFRLKGALLVVMMLHAVTVWSDTCPVGQVPDGIGGNCVACSTCEKYPTSPYCELCPASADRSGGTDGLKIGLSVAGGLLFVLAAAAGLGALWYWKPWRRNPVLQQGQQPVQQPPRVVVQQEEHPPRDEHQCAQPNLPGHQPMRGESPGHVKQEQGARNDRNPNHVAVGSYRQLAGQQQGDELPLLPPPDHSRDTAPKGARGEEDR